jgi:hypothetical protein
MKREADELGPASQFTAAFHTVLCPAGLLTFLRVKRTPLVNSILPVAMVLPIKG